MVSVTEITETSYTHKMKKPLEKNVSGEALAFAQPG